MIKEVIIVEGRDDVVNVKRALDCECIPTHGYGFNTAFLDRLRGLQQRRGLIILTDPDYAGKQIRRRIREAIPEARHAFLARNKSIKGDDIGVENAKPEDILEALLKARLSHVEAIETFKNADILDYGLSGIANSKARRVYLCDRLSIEYSNAKQILNRLNNYGISRKEVEEILSELDD